MMGMDNYNTPSESQHLTSSDILTSPIRWTHFLYGSFLSAVSRGVSPSTSSGTRYYRLEAFCRRFTPQRQGTIAYRSHLKVRASPGRRTFIGVSPDLTLGSIARHYQGICNRPSAQPPVSPSHAQRASQWDHIERLGLGREQYLSGYITGKGGPTLRPTHASLTRRSKHIRTCSTPFESIPITHRSSTSPGNADKNIEHWGSALEINCYNP